MRDAIFLILGVIALIAGLVPDPNIVWLIIVGVVLLALGGVCFCFVDGDGFDFD